MQPYRIFIEQAIVVVVRVRAYILYVVYRLCNKYFVWRNNRRQQKGAAKKKLSLLYGGYRTTKSNGYDVEQYANEKSIKLIPGSPNSCVQCTYCTTGTVAMTTKIASSLA